MLLAISIMFAVAAAVAASPETNLVSNGSFESHRVRAGVPDDWSAAGNAAIRQELSQDAGHDGGVCARLECTAFAGDGPDFHAMICQTGRIAVRQGQWYRLSFWARAKSIRAGGVEVALNCTRPWESAGLSDAFTPGLNWEFHELFFKASRNVPAEASRLQFWFKSTGTLWLDDVTLAETVYQQLWLPEIPTAGVKNFVPNASFECGPANWGSITYGLQGWAGNLYRLEGELDATAGSDGPHSLKIAIGPNRGPVFWFDYYRPVKQPVRRILAANRGWFRVTPGETLTLSAMMKSDLEGAPGLLAINEAPERHSQKPVVLTRDWKRYEFTFKPAQAFLFVAAGLDLENSKIEQATAWIDAVQLERGAQATRFEPRSPVEAFLEPVAATGTVKDAEPLPGPPGNIYTKPANGLALSVAAWNSGGTDQRVSGELRLTDFFDQAVLKTNLSFRVPAGERARVVLPPCAQNQRGFYRATWAAQGRPTQELRCALIKPASAGLSDSALGFNHAYPWDFLVTLTHQAGLVWWRDWSAKWDTVEPERGKFDFSVPDAQIRRVQALGGQVEVLLPFPSSGWSTTAKPETVAEAAAGNSYLKERLPMSFAPKNLQDFAGYASTTARHYAEAAPGSATHIQILNEPVYTDYALPRKFGYSVADYIQLLDVAQRGLKSALPGCRVVGGISANVQAGITREFVTAGGLRSLDVFDLHLYDAARPAETYEEPFAALEQLMKDNGGPKPVWITEWGCYADDDPPCVPQTVGDATMNRCKWANERAATEHIVKFVAISFAHGVRKIFFHAGTCGTINGPDASGVLFEYGGAPRKMYAGVAALTEILGEPESLARRVHTDDLEASVFRCRGRVVAIAWNPGPKPRSISTTANVSGFDIMGNRLPEGEMALTSTPVYLVSGAVEPILQILEYAASGRRSAR